MLSKLAEKAKNNVWLIRTKLAMAKVSFYTVVLVLIFTAENSHVVDGFRKLSVSCDPGTHECNDGSGCYTDDQQCNDVRDCNDGSDEDNHHCGKLNYVTKALYNFY